MSISKPARYLLQLLVFSCLNAVACLWVLRAPARHGLPLLGIGILVSWILSTLFHHIVIDSFDLWLRERTRDTSWLWSDEGKRWLRTPAGQQWLLTEKGAKWAERFGTQYIGQQPDRQQRS
jgi:peptidoglycan/LPS O-acetylase OafA/YrhL